MVSGSSLPLHCTSLVSRLNLSCFGSDRAITLYSLSLYTDKEKVLCRNNSNQWDSTRCDIPSRRVTTMSSRRVITSWRHTYLNVISHCNFNFLGRDMMKGWHIITRRDGILHQGGISLGCNMSTWQKNDKYRPSSDCIPCFLPQSVVLQPNSPTPTRPSAGKGIFSLVLRPLVLRPLVLQITSPTDHQSYTPTKGSVEK